MKHIKPGDFLILLIIIILIFFSFRFSFSKKGSTVLVNAKDKEYVYSLTKDGIYEIEGLNGPTKFQIENEKIRIIDSTCPNKTCVHQGWGTTLVCLPNKVIISVEEEGGFDAIAE